MTNAFRTALTGGSVNDGVVNVKNNPADYSSDWRKSMVTALMMLIIALDPGLGVVKADQRFYVWTYEYKTMEAGRAEMEHYLTLKSPFADSLSGTTTAEHYLEIEMGMNERFDFSIYQVLEQKPAGSLVYKGYKLRARYRFGEKGQFLLDPLFYLEYKGKPDFSEHGLEAKLILAKDIGPLNLALNPVWEAEQEAGKWEQEVKYDAGISYSLSQLVRLGAEFKGSENGHYLGPVIAHGKDELWVALGSGFAITTVADGKPEFMLRMILGIHF